MENEQLKLKFKELADKWQKDTEHMSLIHRKIKHPAYQQIVSMGPVALPLILRELDERPSDWLPALVEITDQDPAPEGATFEQAVQAWLKWGREKGYIN